MVETTKKKTETPIAEENNNRIMAEVLRNGRAVLTSSGTARFIDRREGLATRVYYHGLLPREDISKMLHENGSFIVRTTSTVEVGFNAQKCLSVRWNEKVRHFLLDKSADGFYSLDKQKTKFKSVEDLVDHYFKSADSFSVYHCKLITPIGRAKWEFRHSQIELFEKLGEGMFGEVYSGYLSTKRSRLDVAVKTLKCAYLTKEKIDESMKEARLLRRCHHRNIVRFYGVAAEEEPLMIIMELVTGGSLDAYLEQKAATISVDERLRMCCQAVFAIRYLHQRNILHRDVAARNCLYDREKCLKLSDFGLSVHAKKYRMQRSERIPLRWMSPEVFRTQVYTQHADIWAFGVLVWEIFNNAVEPYANWTGAQIKRELLENNYRLTLPVSAPEPLKKILKRIWVLDEEERLTASDVAIELAKITPDMPYDPSDTTTTTDNYKFLKENNAQSFGGSMESMMRGKDGQTITDPELHMSESIEESSYAPPSEYNNYSGDKSGIRKKKRGSLKKAQKPENTPVALKKRISGSRKIKNNQRTMETQESGRGNIKAVQPPPLKKFITDRLPENQKPKAKDSQRMKVKDSQRTKTKDSQRKAKEKKEKTTTIVATLDSQQKEKPKISKKELKEKENILSPIADPKPEPKKNRKAKHYVQDSSSANETPSADKEVASNDPVLETQTPSPPPFLNELERTQQDNVEEESREPTTSSK